MKKAIHISQALAMLNRGERVTLYIVTAKGKLMVCDDVVSLSYDHYTGTRNIKFLRSGQVRMIHDICIVGINDFEVYL